MEYCRGMWEPEKGRGGRSDTGEEPQRSHPNSKRKSLPNAYSTNKLETQESGLDSNQAEKPECKEHDLVSVQNISIELLQCTSQGNCRSLK